MRYRVIDGKLVKVDEDDAPELKTFSRRRFLSGSFLAVGATALTGCGLPGFGNSSTGSRTSGGSSGGGFFGGGSSGGGGGGSSGGGGS